ncbi:MAG: histidine kinase [Polaribacter sp.]
MNSKYLFIVLWMFTVLGKVNAQTADYRLTPFSVNYSTKDGLPSNETYCVVQDKKGYIWIGTDRGVARFDGENFEIFTTEDGLLDNVVFNIQVHEDGKIWFLPWNNQIFYYEYGKGFMAFKHNKLLSANDSNEMFNIEKMKKDSLGNYYLYNRRVGEGLIKIFPDGSFKKTNVDIADRKNKNLKYNFIKVTDLDIIVRKRNSLVRNDVFSVRHSIGRKQLSYFSNQKYDGSKSAMFIPSYFEEQNASYFITGKYMTKISKKDTIPIILKRGIYATKASGGYIVGHRLKPNENYFDVYWQTSIDSSAEKQLLFKNVFKTRAIKDANQGIWIASHDRGVFYIPDTSILQNKTVENIDGIIPNKNKIFLHNVKNNFFTLKKESEFKIDTHLQSTLSDAQLNYQEPIPQARKVYNTFYFSDNDDKYSLKSSTFGIRAYRYDKEKKLSLLTRSFIAKFLKPQNDLDEHPRIICFEEDDKENFWLGRLDGLYCYLNNKWIKPKFKFGKIEDRIQDIKFFKAKDLSFFATIGNGFYIEKDSLLVKHYTRKNGLLSNSINQLYIDATKKMWIATTSGFHYIDLNEDTLSLNNVLSNFSKLTSPNVKQIYVRDSLIYLGTDRGLNIIDWKKYNKRRTKKFPIYINSFKVNEQSMNIDSTLVNSLSHKQNNIEISFKALAYKNLENISYRYKLSNSQNDWLEIPSTTIRLIDQKPDNYAIEIQAKNDFGEWIASKDTIKFSISKPYQQTYWFQALLYMVITAIAILIYTIYTRNKRKDKELNASMQQLFSSQLNPHFVFNSLSSVQNFILKNERMESNEYLGKFAFLIRRIFENSNVIFITLKDELETLNTYIELEQLRFTQKFDYKLNLDSLIDLKTTLFPSNLLQPIVENAIRHGLLNKEEKGTLSMSIKKISDTLLIKISDNGVGRSKTKNTKKTSKGLSLTQKRLQVLSKMKGKKATIEIEDLVSNNKPTGTTVTIIVPHLTKE